MATVEHCRSMAEEAERLAAVVSYARDKVRLREQAETWRIKADALEAEARAGIVEGPGAHRGVMAWLRGR